MLGRMAFQVTQIAAGMACAAAVISCSAPGDEAPPPAGEEAAMQAPPRDETTTSASAPSASDAPAPAPPPPADPAPGLMFDPPDAAPPPPMAWVIDDANTLVRFPLTAPALAQATKIGGLAEGEAIVGIDIRPADGKIYALGTTSRIYTIDRTTAAATPVSQQPFTPALAGQAFGLDVNPVVDKLRVVTEFDQNLRIDPATGEVVASAADGMLAFADGDPNAGQSPAVVGAAYTNSVAPAPKTTTLYGIDATRDLLVRLPSPNDGKVMTVGSLGVIVADDALGFDIRGSDATKLEAYVAMRVGDANGFYAVDLASGAAKLVAEIPHAAPLHGLAVDP